MIPIFEPEFGGNERKYLLDCIDTGWVSSQGTYITRFEQAFAEWHGVAHAVASSNCTTALHLSLLAAGIGAGDEVLVPDLTFIAPANMVRLTGGKAVLVDIEPETWAIDPVRAREAITPRTRAIIVVHPFGHAADMDPIMELAREHGLAVIEDNAEAPGARYKGRLLGTIGAFGCFSFFGNKIMTSGEGGMVLTANAAFDKELRILRDHGMSREEKYLHVAVGFNYRMTNMQAAIGLAQLERLDRILEFRTAQARRYEARLAESPRLKWRPRTNWCEPVHWLATITVESRAARESLMRSLAADGIETRIMIPTIHSAPPYRNGAGDNAFPVASRIAATGVHLPSGATLRDDDVDHICDRVLAWAKT